MKCLRRENRKILTPRNPQKHPRPQNQYTLYGRFMCLCVECLLRALLALCPLSPLEGLLEGLPALESTQHIVCPLCVECLLHALLALSAPFVVLRRTTAAGFGAGTGTKETSTVGASLRCAWGFSAWQRTAKHFIWYIWAFAAGGGFRRFSGHFSAIAE